MDRAEWPTSKGMGRPGPQSGGLGFTTKYGAADCLFKKGKKKEDSKLPNFICAVSYNFIQMMNSISSVCDKATGACGERDELHRAWFLESSGPMLKS